MTSPMVSRILARNVTGGQNRIARIPVLPQLRDSVQSASSSSAFPFSSRSGMPEESHSSNIPTPQAVYTKVSESFRYAASSAGTVLHKAREAKLVDSVRTGYTFLKEEMSNTSPRRRQNSFNAPAAATPENFTVSAIVPVVKKTTGWEKRWETLKEKAKAHPAFKRIKIATYNPVVNKGQELAEDLRERWETSDSPVVHKIQDLNDSLFGETATAVATREIRRHDPSFTFSDFLAEIQEEIRPTLRAYLKGDLATLKKKCSREVVERCQAERRALESQGIFLDNEILHLSTVEMKETKLLGNSPIIIITFQTQQIHCAWDKAGNIIEGARDDIHSVLRMGHATRESCGVEFWRLSDAMEIKRDAASGHAGTHIIDSGVCTSIPFLSLKVR